VHTECRPLVEEYKSGFRARRLINTSHTTATQLKYMDKLVLSLRSASHMFFSGNLVGIMIYNWKGHVVEFWFSNFCAEIVSSLKQQGYKIIFNGDYENGKRNCKNGNKRKKVPSTANPAWRVSDVDIVGQHYSRNGDPTEIIEEDRKAWCPKRNMKFEICCNEELANFNIRIKWPIILSHTLT